MIRSSCKTSGQIKNINIGPYSLAFCFWKWPTRCLQKNYKKVEMFLTTRGTLSLNTAIPFCDQRMDVSFRLTFSTPPPLREPKMCHWEQSHFTSWQSRLPCLDGCQGVPEAKGHSSGSPFLWRQMLLNTLVVKPAQLTPWFNQHSTKREGMLELFLILMLGPGLQI